MMKQGAAFLYCFIAVTSADSALADYTDDLENIAPCERLQVVDNDGAQVAVIDASHGESSSAKVNMIIFFGGSPRSVSASYLRRFHRWNVVTKTLAFSITRKSPWEDKSEGDGYLYRSDGTIEFEKGSDSQSERRVVLSRFCGT